ncbi:MAG: MCP four helix bundle domain-containing protein [Myxococcaceae bacterium]|nr:MCP four helix bundle domain-containing protein [Myxococcaceae bacterium]
MDRNSQGTFERVVWFAFAASAAMLVAVTTLGAVMLLRTLSSKDEVIFKLGNDLYAMERLRIDAEREAREVRTWMLTRDPSEREAIRGVQRELDRSLRTLQRQVTDEETRRLLQQVIAAEHTYRSALASQLDTNGPRTSAEMVDAFEANVGPERAALDGAIEALVGRQRQAVSDAIRASEDDAREALTVLISAAALSALAALALGILLTRAMRTQARQRRELEENVERVAQANQDLEAFAGRLSHDLKNMLAPAVLATSRLKRAGERLGSEAAAVARLESSLQRTLRAMEGLLAFSRAGQPADPLARSNAHRVLEGVLEEIQPLRMEVGAEVEVSVHGPVEVRCAPALLHVVLANLLNNALKYLAGHPVRRVKVRIDGGPEWVTMTIHDTGPGIAPEHRERVFEAFYRPPGQTIAGTGIGLATVKRIVDAHGGRIELRSGPGRGSTFTVILHSAADGYAAMPSETGAPRPH